MSAPPSRPRPIADISARQSWWAILSALTPGAIILATVLAGGGQIGVADLGAAALAILLPLAGAEKARRKTVELAEPLVTPAADPRDSDGRPLTPPDPDLKRLLRARLAAEGAPERPRRQGPDGTQVSASLGEARPMRADDVGAYRATESTPPPRPVDPWPAGADYVGDRAREYDEQQAQARHPAGRRRYRGGPTDGGGAQ